MSPKAKPKAPTAAARAEGEDFAEAVARQAADLAALFEDGIAAAKARNDRIAARAERRRDDD